MTGSVGRRPTLVVVGLLYLAAAVNLRPPYPLAPLVQSLPWLWEAVFGAAAITCIGCALRPPPPSIRFASFMLVTLAAVSRAMALWGVTPHAVNWLPPPNAIPWLITAVFQLVFWLVLVSWTSDRRER